MLLLLTQHFNGQELRLLPITDVIQQLFAMVSYLDVVAA